MTLHFWQSVLSQLHTCSGFWYSLRDLCTLFDTANRNPIVQSIINRFNSSDNRLWFSCPIPNTIVYRTKSQKTKPNALCAAKAFWLNLDIPLFLFLFFFLSCLHGWSNRWMIRNFTSFSTVFQSYQDNEKLIMKSCVQWNRIYGREDFAWSRAQSWGCYNSRMDEAFQNGAYS